MNQNSIIVFADPAKNGNVIHKFCTEEEGSAFFNDAEKNRKGASFIRLEGYDNAELLFDVSPNLRERVERAKSKLREDLRVQAVMDKHGVPTDLAVRMAVTSAYKELMDGPLAIMAALDALQ